MSFRQQSLNACPNFLVSQQFAAINPGQPLFHFADKPFVIIDETLYGFSCQDFGIASALNGNTREPGLHIRVKTHFHARQFSSLAPGVSRT